MASFGVAAETVSNSHFRSWVARIRRLVALSSTTKILLPDQLAPMTGAPSCGGATFWGIVNWNADPVPTSLSTQMRPPMSSVNRLLIARPRPVPPYFLVVDASTWLNDWNSRSKRSAGIPQPVSRTTK